jgi:bifunctional DNA-binding transcriptional regulator/antitoxin component of YhaV-PrlF toxin-antitoxin module
MTIKENAKVMQNFTICLPKKIRKEMAISVKDTIMLVFKNGELTLKKAPSSWEDLAKISPKVFKKYGGGEKYLKEEREAWYE